MRIVLYSFVFSFFLMLSGCPASNPTCTDDTGCTEPQICCKTGTYKETPTCVEKAKCNTCGEGVTQCLDRNECGSNQVCTNGCCAAYPNVGKDCKKDTDCGDDGECIPDGAGFKCNICVISCKSNSDCSSDTVCEEKCCRVPACQSDANCKEANKPKCDAETAKCVACLADADCPTRQACRDKQCRQVQCREDKDCTDSQKPVCDAYVCKPPIICKTDADCAQRNPGTDLTRCDAAANENRGECRKGLCATCVNDDDCGTGTDFCVGKDKGLKDGPRCLTACESTNDCPQNFFCSSDKVTGFKVCYPQTDFCADPCIGVSCKPGEEICVEGTCKKIPQACDSCAEHKDCNVGASTANQCVDYSGTKFCGKSCNTAADCPTPKPGQEYDCLSIGASKQCILSKGSCQ
ncbi:MAG: hypothetical protein H6728_17600 [Myxococcales bacterium]|nr:hypothetical protein [Myxococcales bacterium]MCB9644890.1 hypothetical protein [Myxococcales bacterium]